MQASQDFTALRQAPVCNIVLENRIATNRTKSRKAKNTIKSFERLQSNTLGCSLELQYRWNLHVEVMLCLENTHEEKEKYTAFRKRFTNTYLLCNRSKLKDKKYLIPALKHRHIVL